MDPVSLTGTVIAVVQVGAKVTSMCYEYWSNVRNSQKDIARIIQEITSLHNVLERLLRLTTDEPNTVHTLHTLALPGAQLDSCLADLQYIKHELKPPLKQRKLSVTPLLWPLKEKQVSKSLSSISRAREMVILSLTADNAINVSEMTQDVSLIKKRVETLTLLGEDDRSEKIFEWLVPSAWNRKHDAVRQTFTPGTGNWLLAADSYRAWCDGQKSLLLVQGMLGCGKTFLASAVIEDLQKHPKEKTVLFHYFDKTAPNNENPALRLLKSLIGQLCLSLGHIPKVVEELYVEEHSQRASAHKLLRFKNVAKISLTQYLIASLSRLAKQRNVYVVIDALDEASSVDKQFDEVVNVIHQLANQHDIKVTVTSRPSPGIEQDFFNDRAELVTVATIYVDADIRVYVSSHFRSNKKLQNWPQALQNEAEEIITQKSQGSFVWASCQLNNLSKCTTPRSIRTSLRAIPDTLQETYFQVLEGMDGLNKDVVKIILQWLCYAPEALRLSELADVLAVEHDSPNLPYYSEDLKLLSPETVPDLCSGLVKTVYGNDGIYVKLAHLSVQEFLTSDALRNSSFGEFAVTTENSRKLIMNTCLAHLFRLDDELSPSILEASPFILYAARHWFDVCRSILPVEKETTCYRLQSAFLTGHNGLPVKNWTRLYRIDMPWAPPNFSKDHTPLVPLYCCAYGGFLGICKELLAQGAEPNSRGGLLGCPLEAAAEQGYDEVVELLLDSGAWVNNDPGITREKVGEHGTAIAAAIVKGHVSTVTLLLQRGAEVQGRSFFRGHNNLILAAKNGQEEICQILLDHGARDHFEFKGSPTSALEAASIGNYKGIVSKLLKYRDADADRPDTRIILRARSSLDASQHTAASLRRPDILKELMSHGIAPEVKFQYAVLAGDMETAQQVLESSEAASKISQQRFKMCVSDAVRAGNLPLAKYLVYKIQEHDALDVETKTSSMALALTHAIKQDDLEAIKMLVDLGAEVDKAEIGLWDISTLDQYRGRYGNRHMSSSLLCAAGAGNIRSFTLLQSLGADPNVRTDKCVVASAKSGQFEIFSLLLEAPGALPTTEGGFSKLLRSAVRGGSHEIVKVVLDRSPFDLFQGQNVQYEHQNKHPLYVAISSGRLAIVRLLISRGVPVNMLIKHQFQDRRECPLSCAIYEDRADIVRLLLDSGAELSLLEAPLVQATMKGSMQLVSMLLDAGADVDASYTTGIKEKKTPLLIAITNGKCDIVDLLLSRGADVNLENDGKFTPLHVAAREGKTLIMERLLEQGAQLDAALINGSTPLHSAASSGQTACLQLLLERGLYINATNKDGRSPLHWAVTGGWWPTVEFLLDRGADTSLRADDTNVTAWDLAHITRRNALGSSMCRRKYTTEQLDDLFERLAPPAS